MALVPSLNALSQTRPKFKPMAAALTSGVAIALSLWITPALADPFRGDGSDAIDDNTEEIFETIFVDGNYQSARAMLANIDTDDPLAYAMRASIAYLNHDWTTMGESATLTREKAEQLMASDPLRGHLYTATGIFLEGAYTLSSGDGNLVAQTPAILGKLQEVFSELDAAEAIDPNDPELNLLRGYMDLMLAVNLPFTDPQQAITRLQDYAAPTYLAQRGMAIAYRDLAMYDEALAAVDMALADTPENPDLFYLKAQILRLKGDNAAAIENFGMALEKRDQLFSEQIGQISYEQCRTAGQSGCSQYLE